MATTHRRKLIRDAVVAALIAASTAAESRIYPSRAVPWKRLQLPAVAVYSLSESSDDQQTAPREHKRKLQLAIEAAVKGDNPDDLVDALALQIERAMNAEPSFGDVCSDSTLSGTEIEVAEQGDQLIGFLRLTYAVTYYTPAPDADDVTLVDLSTIDVKHNLAGVQAAADMREDKIEDLEA